MPDNVGYTPGSGATVAADDVGGVLFQRVKLAAGADGVAVDVSADAGLPVIGTGELIEVLESLRMAVHSLTRSVGQSYPDVSGRLRVALDSITGALTLATVTTVTTVATVTNQTQIGGVNASPQIPALMMLGVDTLRRNISVS